MTAAESGNARAFVAEHRQPSSSEPEASLVGQAVQIVFHHGNPAPTLAGRVVSVSRYTLTLDAAERRLLVYKHGIRYIVTTPSRPGQRPEA